MVKDRVGRFRSVGEDLANDSSEATILMMQCDLCQVDFRRLFPDWHPRLPYCPDTTAPGAVSTGPRCGCRINIPAPTNSIAINPTANT